jgi:hypothetical protein
MQNEWFTVSKEGLARLLERRGKSYAIWELIQNAWDEDTSRVVITLEHAGRGVAFLTVEDDNPTGFADLTHAFTLFADSTKKGDVEKRGRFNLGEKLVLALCTEASVKSTTGRVVFRADGTRDNLPRQKTDAGTIFDAKIRFTKVDIDEATRLVGTLLPPPGIETVFNGQVIPAREPVRELVATLPTEVADEEGVLRPTRRKTTVQLFEPRPGETAHIYEMGIPVVEHDGRWHVNVGQKVPLNFNRDNVTPAYLCILREAVLNVSYDLLDQEEAHKPWVTDALPRASQEALVKVLDERFGKRRVFFDRSDPEATKNAAGQGYAVIHGRQLPREVRERVREAQLIRRAGDVLPSGVPSSPDGKPPIPHDDWTDEMKLVADYVQRVGTFLLGYEPEVEFAVHVLGRIGNFRAWFGGGTVTFNLGRLGTSWPATVEQLELDELLIHEFAHDLVTDHLSHAFHNECCRLGAKLRGCNDRWTPGKEKNSEAG